MRNRLRNGMTAAAGWLGGYIEEMLTVLAIVLLVIGFWDAWRPGSFIAPAVIVLWIVLPARGPFVVSPSVTDAHRRTE